MGASTVAVNLSAALARMPDTRVLLADFDLNSGLTGFMLKLDNPYSVTSAAENSLRMDEALWRQLVSVKGSLDVLPSGKINPGFRIEPAQIRSLLDFARRQYKAICVDLSGNLEKYSVEIQHESKRIFLVCTAELPSLHLAREKLAFLRSIDLEDRVDVVLNRAGKHDVVTAEEVEKLLGRPMPVHLSQRLQRDSPGPGFRPARRAGHGAGEALCQCRRGTSLQRQPGTGIAAQVRRVLLAGARTLHAALQRQEIRLIAPVWPLGAHMR